MRLTKSRREVRRKTIQENENGIVAFACGVISAISFIVLIFISFLNKGDAGLTVGIIGMMSMIISLVGLIIGTIHIKTGDKSYFFSKAGFFINVIVVVIWALVFVFGLYR